MAKALPSSLQHFAVRYLGNISHITTMSSPYSRCKVWRLQYSLQCQKHVAYLKHHPHNRSYQQEKRAYVTWWGNALYGKIPQLLALHDVPPYALLLKALPGKSTLHPSEAVAAQAGTLLRQLHSTPFKDDDPLPLSQALHRRLMQALRRDTLLTTQTKERLQTEVLRATAYLADATRVPCHGDFTPQNWLLSPTNTLCVIDFEHSKPNHPFSDLTRLALTLWQHDKRQQAVFWQHYTASPREKPTEKERTVLHAFCTLEALGTLSWGYQHNDQALYTQGKNWLHQLGLFQPLP